MRRLAAIALLVLAAACPKAPPKEPKVEPAKPSAHFTGPRGVLQTAYRALEEGDADRIERLLTKDVLAFGLAPSDTFNSREGIVEMVRQSLLPLGLRGQKLTFSESHIVAVIAPGNRSAILYDLPRMEIDRGAKGVQVWLPRITAHAVLEEEWRLDAVHVSIGVPEQRLYEPGAERAFLPPGDVTPEVKGDADQLVGLTKRILADMKTRLDRLSDSEDAVQLGTAPGDVYEGGAPFKKLVRPLLRQLKRSGQTQEMKGDVRARIAPGGKTGWVAAQVVMTVGRGRKQVTLPTFRGLWIYAEEGGIWNLMSEHLSLGLKVNQRDPASDETLKARAEAQKAREAAEQKEAGAEPDGGVPELARPPLNDSRLDPTGAPPKRDEPPAKDEKKKKDDAPMEAW